jgi:hypothetical protein
MRRPVLFFAAVLVTSSLVQAAAPTPVPAPADAQPGATETVRPAAPQRLDPNVFRCGPIHSSDPRTRARIESLYREEFDLRKSTEAQLRDLVQRARSTTDPAAEMELSRQGGQIKLHLQRRHMELGLEIARLNQDAPSVAEYEKALDHLLHPEKYQALPSAAELRARRPAPEGAAK